MGLETDIWKEKLMDKRTDEQTYMLTGVWTDELNDGQRNGQG